MPARVQSALGRLVAVIREFTVAQRTLAIIGVIGVVVGAIALGAWLMKPTYSPLFSGLSGTDASAIVEQLKTDGVDYQLADGGSTILVPDASVDKERLAAAAAGLPGDKTAGYSLLDNMGVTSSEFQQTVTYKRALEGELSKTVEGLDGVRTASVKLAIPQQSVFVSQQTTPTASVFLDLKPGVALGKEQVKAVTHLVSASVDGMSPDDVAVVDADGQVLSAVGGQDAAGGSDSAGSDYETKTSAAIQAMLDKVVGPGNATVVVTADVSQESAQRTEEKYSTPDGDPAYSESVQQSGSGAGSGTGSGQAGVLGPDNIAVPNGTAGGSGASGSSGGPSSTVRDNAVDKTTETRTIPAGELTKQAVSVAVNSDKVTISSGAISTMVAAAAGIDKARGDVVSVQKVSFAKAAAADAKSAIADQQSSEGQQSMTQIITTGIIAGAVILGLIIILTVLMRAGRRRAEQAELALGELEVNPLLPAEGGVGALLAGAQPGRLDAAPAPASIAPAPEPLPVEIGGVDRVRASVEALAGSDPERTAEYLRSLMDDRQPA